MPAPTTVTISFDPAAINRQTQIIPAATENNPGVMTPAQAAKLASLTPSNGITQLEAGNGIELTPSPIVGPGGGTVAVAPSGVAAGSYTNPNLTIGADGRITDAVNGPPTPPARSIFHAYTATNNTASVNIFTTPPNSAALLRVNVIGVSDYFTTVASYEADITVRRDGSGDGSTFTYTLLRSSVQSELSPAGIFVPNAHTAGVVVLELTGKSLRPIYWTIEVVSLVATRGQS